MKINGDEGDELVALREENARLRAALKEAVYEATHLSPQETDGSHWAKMSAAWLTRARAALDPQDAELVSDSSGCTICPECKGNQWRAVKNSRIGPGIYEVRCDKCNGFGWIDEEHPVRP